MDGRSERWTDGRIDKLGLSSGEAPPIRETERVLATCLCTLDKITQGG